MKYLFLVYQDNEQWAKVSTGEQLLIEEACLAHEQEMRERGYLLAVEDFQHNQTRLTIQLVDGQVLLGEGFSAETKQLIQLFFIHARDLNEAIQLVSNMPQMRKGPVEVRTMVNQAWSLQPPPVAGREAGIAI
jgi:hypothetical protein